MPALLHQQKQKQEMLLANSQNAPTCPPATELESERQLKNRNQLASARELTSFLHPPWLPRIPKSVSWLWALFQLVFGACRDSPSSTWTTYMRGSGASKTENKDTVREISAAAATNRRRTNNSKLSRRQPFWTPPRVSAARSLLRSY